jgi:ABC-type transporter Mla subunit MlaD
MELVLYILGALVLIGLIVLIVRSMRTLGNVDALLRESQFLMEETRKDLGRIADDVSELKSHALPVIDNISNISNRVASISEGLHARIDDIYGTLDDALDVAHGAIEDIERIKGNVVATIDAPLSAVRHTSEGLVSGIIKGVSLVRDLLDSFRKNGKK